VNDREQPHTKERTEKERQLLNIRCLAAWELPHLRGREEVHHRLIAYLHRKQLRYLHVSIFARFPARRPPDSFPKLLLLIFPPPTMVKEVFPRLGHPPARHLGVNSV